MAVVLLQNYIRFTVPNFKTYQNDNRRTKTHYALEILSVQKKTEHKSVRTNIVLQFCPCDIIIAVPGADS